LLVGEAQWDETTPERFTSSYLEPFGGLNTVLLLLYTDDEDGSAGAEDVEDVEDAESVDDENCEVGRLGNDKGGIESGALHARADRFQAEYADFLERHDRAAKRFWCVDCRLTVY
jgi:hypothetical protein